MSKNKTKNQSGFSIVELVVALVIISMLLATLIGALLLSLRAVTQAEREARAYFFAQDAIEAIKNIRDRKWDEITNVVVDTIVHPEEQAGEWKLVAGSDTNDVFTRETVLSYVLRDGDGQIVEQGGTADPNMRKVKVTVSWNEPSSGAKSIKLANYVTDWQFMDSFIYYFHQTNKSDFAAGIVSNVDPDLRPGELVLKRTNIYSHNFNLIAGSNPPNWADTAANYSLSAQENFQTFNLSGELVYRTTSTAANIHSHYIGSGYRLWTNYEVRGRIRLSDLQGGAGVTFFSRYIDEDKYFRLYTNDGQSFRIDGRNTTLTALGVDDRDTEVVPVANTWYWFRIQVKDVSNQTLIIAKVWQQGTLEPASWQVDCYSAEASRPSSGTVGFWTTDQGSKYFDDLEVINLNQYQTAGTLESSTFDTGQASNFDKIKWNAYKPAGTTLRFQVRTADTQADLAVAQWYGPTGTGDYFQTNSLGEKLPVALDGKRWIQYKVFLDTTNNTISPSLEDITISYAKQ